MRRFRWQILAVLVILAFAYVAEDYIKTERFWQAYERYGVADSVINGLVRGLKVYYVDNNAFPPSALASAQVVAALTTPVPYLKIPDYEADYTSGAYVVDPYASGNRRAKFLKITVRGGFPRYYTDGKTYAVFVSAGPDGVLGFDEAHFRRCTTFRELRDYVARTGVPIVRGRPNYKTLKGDLIGACVRDGNGNLHLVGGYYYTGGKDESPDIPLALSPGR